MLNLDDNSTRNNVTWFLMGNFLRPSPWSGGPSHSFLRERKRILPHLYFFLDNSEILQLCRRRQIIEPRKYCLVRVIIFLWHVFSLFCFSQVGNFMLTPYILNPRPTWNLGLIIRLLRCMRDITPKPWVLLGFEKYDIIKDILYMHT